VKRQLPVEPGHRGTEHDGGHRRRQRQQRAQQGIALDQMQQTAHLQPGRRGAQHAGQPVAVAFGQAQRDAATQRITHGEDGLARPAGRVAHRRQRELVKLGQDGVGSEAIGGAEAGQVDCQRALPPPRQQSQRLTPGVGAVGVSVQQQDRHSPALQLQHPGLIARQRQPVLEQRLDHALAGAAPRNRRSGGHARP
jgi:hypothetical protein